MRPKRSLGQNFLIDPNLQRKIVDALGVEAGDEVLEIGPGRGALTGHLVEAEPGRLILVELDGELAAALRSEFAEAPNVEVIHGDVLELELGEVVRDPAALKVVGNIPYNITTPIVFKLLERPRPREILVMVQKEVGERITAEPGTSAYGALAVGVQSVARAERLFDVGRGAFRPRPRVDSTLVRIRPLDPPPQTPREEGLLRSLTRVAFQWRRKQFQTTLRKHPRYDLSPEEVTALEERTGFDLTRRPERFSPGELLEIARVLDEGGRPRGEAR